ncbi:MAG: hypothetical protein H7326_09170 [Bdellovibrionaceae bacterium]|nr:hypothetical protein [Pseudobdellovibrionaceae bacterium]
MPSGNKRFQFSISSRISLLFSATFASGLLIAFVVTYFQIQKSLEESNRTVMTAKLQETSAILSTEGVDGLRGFLAEEKNRIVNAPFLIRVLTVDGGALFTKPSVQQETFDFDSLSKEELHPEQILGWHALSAVNDEDKFDLLTEKVRDNLYIRVGKSSEDREEILERIVSVFAVTGGVIALLSILLGI